MTMTRPPEASRAGKNKYYHQCDEVGSSRHYGICLFTIEAFERGQELMETPCVNAMKAGTCPAMKMRQEERDAGQSLYYVEPDPEKAVDPKDAQRERAHIDRTSPSYRRGFSGPIWGGDESKEKARAKPKPTAAKPAPQKRTAGDMIEFDSSKIVNALIDSPPTTFDGVKQRMLEVSRPAALRRKQAIDAGEEVKPSVFDYMTDEENEALTVLKAEMNKLRKQQEVA